MMRAIHLVTALAILLAYSGQMQAGVIRVDLTAEVTYFQNTPIAGVSTSLGDLVSASFFYDTHSLDLDPIDPTRGIYFSGSASINVSGHTITSTGPQLEVVFDVNGPNDLFGISNADVSFWSPILIDGVMVTDVYYFFGFTQPLGALTSDGLPSVSDIGTLKTYQFAIGQPSTDGLIMFDHLLSLSATEVASVPEPSSMTILGIVACMSLLGGVQVRRRRASTTV